MSKEGQKNSNIIIAMPPPHGMETEGNSHENTRAETESKMEEEAVIQEEETPRRNAYHFADKVVVDGKTILEISDDKVFYEEEKIRRSTRWTDPKTKKKVDHTDIHFDPIKALVGAKASALPMLTMGGTPPPVIAQKKVEPQERPTKWGREEEKTFKPPKFHSIARGIPLEDVEYLMRLYRLDELIKKKNLGQLDLEDIDCRSPSPEPIYDKEGKRLNTTEKRMKDEMMAEIQALIDDCQNMNPKFVPPHEFRNLKKTRKIYLPESTDGKNNYAGLILGQKGENQKRIETKTGCKISLRGRQAYMKRRYDYDPDEQTHVLVQAKTDDQLERGVRMIQNLLKGEPEDMTDDEKANKYQLMAVSSTLDKFCINCHQEGHRMWECPNKKSFKKPLVKCSICGDFSHPSNDCPQKRAGTGNESIEAQKELIDFINSVEQDVKEKPLPSNPLSYMNFITDWSGQNLALMNSASNPGKQPTAEQSQVEFIPGNQRQAENKPIQRGLPALPAPEKN